MLGFALTNGLINADLGVQLASVTLNAGGPVFQISGALALQSGGSITHSNGGGGGDPDDNLPTIALNGPATFTKASGDLIMGLDGAVTGTGPLTLVNNGGDDLLRLAAVSTYTGVTTVNGTGRVRFNMNGAVPTGSALTVNGSALFQAASTIGSLAGGGNVFMNGSNALTAGGDNTSTTFSGIYQDSGGAASLTKTGAGTLTLSGVNTYTGSTTVSGGTLLVNGSTAAGSTITVASGATLGGAGTINGNVVVQPGGSIGSGLTMNGAVTPAATSTSVSASAGTVTYGTAQTLTATVTSGGVAVTAGSVTFTDTTTSTTLASNVALNGSGQTAKSATLASGSHTIQATYNPDTGHSGSSNTTSVTVNKAALTVSADTKTISYAAPPALTATISGFLNGDTSGVVSGSASLTTNATLTNGNPNAGLWTVTPAVGTLSAANYSFTTFSTGSLTVNKAGLTVTADAKTISYPAAPAFTAIISGFLNGDTTGVVTGAATFSTNATTTNGNPNAGSWTITPAVGTLTASNYSFGTFATGALTVNKAALTVTADPKTITYPAAAPALSATVTGLVNGDTAGVVTGSASFTTNATTTNGNPNAGSWTITPALGTLTASNYSFGTLRYRGPDGEQGGYHHHRHLIGKPIARGADGDAHGHRDRR